METVAASRKKTGEHRHCPYYVESGLEKDPQTLFLVAR